MFALHLVVNAMDSLASRHIEDAKKQIISIIILSVLTILLSIIAIGQGSSSSLDMWKTAKIIFGIDEPDKLQSSIIWELRFPRILMAIIGGIALATAGALMQGVCCASEISIFALTSFRVPYIELSRLSSYSLAFALAISRAPNSAV